MNHPIFIVYKGSILLVNAGGIMPCSKVYILESFDRLVGVDNSIGCGAYFSSPSALPWSLNVFLRRMETGSQKLSEAAEVGELLESVCC